MPLSFVVYHDFILRYPRSDKIKYAKTRLIEHIKNTIKSTKEAARNKRIEQEKKDKFLKIILSLNHFVVIQLVIKEEKKWETET